MQYLKLYNASKNNKKYFETKCPVIIILRLVARKRLFALAIESIFQPDPLRGYMSIFFFFFLLKKVREKSRECHNHKPQPFPDPKRKRKPTNLNKHKPNKRTKSTKISALFPKRGNRNTKRTEKHKNKMTHGKTYNKSPRRINYKATRCKTNTGTTALERSVERTTGGFTAS